MLNPWRLRLLTQLDNVGTIRGVADTLHLSASTVSAQLAVLESETRTTLLERSGRRVRLTGAGLLLAQRGREILDHMAAVEAELRALGDEAIGTVRLGMFQSAISTLGMPAAARLATTHPHLGLELVELEPHESGASLTAGESDVIVTTTDYLEFPWARELDIVALGTDPIVLVLPSAHPLARQQVVDLASCADQTWICDRNDTYMAEVTERLCRQSGFEPRVAFRFSSVLMLLQHVEAGRGVALLPALAIGPEHDVAARALTLPVHRNVAIATRRGVTPPAVHAVVEALRNHPDIAALSSPHT